MISTAKKLAERVKGRLPNDTQAEEGNKLVGNFEVGKHTYGHEYVSVKQWGEGAKLTIGSFCSIADEITVFLGGNHRIDWATTYPFPEFFEHWDSASGITGHPSTNGDVVIGNDVWIGSHSVIMSGVTIGDGAVIGAYSLVTKDVPPYAIVGGNPARLIRLRFSPSIVDSLLKIAWWEWDDSRIAKSIQLLCSNDIKSFIKSVRD